LEFLFPELKKKEAWQLFQMNNRLKAFILVAAAIDQLL
jgi:hypothetical protein